jgi:hypothetical protein
MATKLPPALVRRRVLRPQDAAEVYAHPRPEFARLQKTGVLHRLANGYYAVVPDDQDGREWLPELEAAAFGVAAADQGAEAVTLMGLSAARVHGAIPRALGVAVVATTAHRNTLKLTDRDASIIFVRRDVPRLDVQWHRTELGQALVTTVEQTLLDLGARTDLGDLPDEAEAAIHALIPRADKAILGELAMAQRRRATLDRILG